MGTEAAPSSFPIKYDPPHSRVRNASSPPCQAMLILEQRACADRSRSVFRCD